MASLRVAIVVTRIGTVELFAQPMVAALAQSRGHQVTLVEYARNPRRALRELAAFAPDVIAYSVCSNEAHEYLQINRDLKAALRFVSVFGGPHPTYTPSLIHEDGVDAVCRGEGDEAFPLFLDRFGTDAMYETPNFLFKTDNGVRENPLLPLIDDLDALPFPARELTYARSAFIARNPVKGFMAGRGCPFNCAYCFNHIYHRIYKGKGRMVRVKSVDYLLKEIRDVAARTPLAFIRFYDDLFGADLEWLDEFADRFPKEIGVRFSCNVRPNVASAEYVELLRRAGCHSAYTAIECGNERLRIEVLGRQITNDQIRESCARLKQAGIRVIALNMVGVPGETEADIWDTIRFNRELGVDFADVTVFQPYPGTEAAQYCIDHGYVRRLPERFESMYVASALDIDPAFKQRIFILHKLLAILVDYPAIEHWVRRLPNSSRLNALLTLIYRLYYGHVLHREAFASAIPLRIRARGALQFILSRNRV